MTEPLTLALFLAAFAHVADDQLTLPLSPDTKAIIETLPRDPQAFEPLAEEAFQQLLLEQQDEIVFQRFVDCLRILLYHDGRTELALLRVADLAHQNPSHATEGINALATLANHYAHGSSHLPLDELLARLDRYRGTPALEHNATACQRYIRKKLQ